MRVRVVGAAVALLLLACSRSGEPEGRGGAETSVGGSNSSGGKSPDNGVVAGASSTGGQDGGSGSLPQPRYHPPQGFEDCKHAEVKADCQDGWCRLPPSCFVMGSPEDEWRRGRSTETQVAVTLTHRIEIQQRELTRAEWESITTTPAPGPENCTLPDCPVAMVSWWEAIHAANLLSAQKGLPACYAPMGCTGTLGKDLTCTGVQDPDKKVYECEGYRLPTRAEAEYAARAGTISTFYSGDITPFQDITICNIDPALELIGWYCGNSGGRAHPGGELLPNGFGLYDMIGNLGEWNNDQQHFSSSEGGMNPGGKVEWGAERLRFSPQYDDKNSIARPAGLLSAPWDARGNQGGFRLVRTLDPNPEQE